MNYKKETESKFVKINTACDNLAKIAFFLRCTIMGSPNTSEYELIETKLDEMYTLLFELKESIDSLEAANYLYITENGDPELVSATGAFLDAAVSHLKMYTDVYCISIEQIENMKF